MDDNAASKQPESEPEEEGIGKDGSVSDSESSESETDSDDTKSVMEEDDTPLQALKVKEPDSQFENEEFIGDGDNFSPHLGDDSGGNVEVKFKGDGVESKDVKEQSLVASEGDDNEMKDVDEQSLDDYDSVKSRGVDDVEPKDVNEQSLAAPVPEQDSTHLTLDAKAEGEGYGGHDREELKDSSPESLAKKEMWIPMLGGSGAGRSPKLCFDNKGGETEGEQEAFAKEVEAFYKGKHIEFKHPKFYKEDLNLLKLWRAVIELGGYEQVTSCKLWRQVGESFNPPKTCTTVSWTFRNFYEKALLDYEKHKMHGGELKCPVASFPESNGTPNQAVNNQAIGSGSGRARRDAAARAMQGWHSQRLLGNGEDKIPTPAFKGLPKRKRPSSLEHNAQAGPFKSSKPHLDTMVIDIGPPAEWVKINVQKLNDCFEVYGLIPGLLRDEVHVQSDPVGRLVITGQPKELNNPWGVTPFKKVVSFPSRIDPHQISAVVTLHGQLFIRVPLEQMEQL